MREKRDEGEEGGSLSPSKDVGVGFNSSLFLAEILGQKNRIRRG